MNSYELTPIEAANAKNLGVREKPVIRFKWNIELPKNPSKAYKVWVKNKAHIEKIFPVLMVLSSDEIFRVSEAIEKGLVPNFFKVCIDLIKENRDEIKFLGEVKFSSYEPFLYNDNEKLRKDFAPDIKKRKVFNLVQNIPESLSEFMKGMENARHEVGSERKESQI